MSDSDRDGNIITNKLVKSNARFVSSDEESNYEQNYTAPPAIDNADCKEDKIQQSQSPLRKQLSSRRKMRIKRHLKSDESSEEDIANDIIEKSRNSTTESKSSPLVKSLNVKYKKVKSRYRRKESTHEEEDDYSNLLHDSKDNNDSTQINNKPKSDAEDVFVATLDGKTSKQQYSLLGDDDFMDDSENEESTNVPEKDGKRKRKMKLKEMSEKVKKVKNDESEKKKKKFKEKKGKNEQSELSTEDKQEKKPKQSRKSKENVMVEIKSTTQRMIREGRISLPYHQPKQRSLDEFLKRRSNVLAIPLKATADILPMIKERLELKEQEVVEFYKSESEHSDLENEENCVVPKSSSSDKNINAEEPSSIINAGITDGITTSTVLNNPDTVSENQIENKNVDNEKISDEEESQSNDIDNEATCCLELLDKISTDNLTKTEKMPKETNIDENISEKKESPSNNIDDSSACSSKLGNEVSTNISLKELTKANTDSEILLDSEFSLRLKDSEDVLPDSEFSLRLEDTEKEDPIESSASKILPSNLSTSNVQNSSIAKCDSSEKSFSENNAMNEPQETLVDDEKRKKAIDELLETIVTPNLKDPKILAEELRKQKLEFLAKNNVELPSAVNLKKEGLAVEIEVAPNKMSTQNAGIERLFDRLMKHVLPQKKQECAKNKILNIVRTERNNDGEIINVVNESITLPSKVCAELPSKKFDIPGSKHSYFKQVMMNDLLAKKEANWKKYQEKKSKMYDSDGSGELLDDDEFVHSDKPGFEPYHPEDEPDDDELIENDIDLRDEVEETNEFLDDEAEVSFDEDENIHDEHSENEDEIDDGDDEKITDDEEEKEVSKEITIEDLHTQNLDDIITSDGTTQNYKLFQHEISAQELENKAMGLGSVNTQSDEFTDSQIFGICSGKFATQTQKNVPNVNDDDIQFSTGFSQFPQDSQDMVLTTPNENGNEDVNLNVLKSPLKSQKQSSQSDNSDNEELFIKKKNIAYIQESDDEEDANQPQESGSALEFDENEEEDVPEAVSAGEESDDEENELDVNEEDELNYNSEEELVTTKPSDFFEHEAELSESEWGSDDENEKDMDVFEKEDGDDDIIDENKLQNELGKIHMRHMLDDDQKNVNLLKEILLEDGELHSDSKRLRKFRWKNEDGDNFLTSFNDSDDENTAADEDNAEVEENWRKIRHEREQFLSKQEKRSELLETIDDDIKLGFSHFANTKITTSIIQGTPNPKVNNELLKSPNSKLPVDTKFKCGSFLAKGKQFNNRIATLIPEIKNNIKGAKKGNNFVFATIEREQITEIEQSTTTDTNKNEKRKMINKSATVAKRLRLSAAAKSSNVSRSNLLAQLVLND